MRPPPARLAAALALLVCALPAAAQTSPDSVAWQRFWPHAIGDTWEYYYYRVCYSSGCSSSPLPYGEVRQVVVGDTLIEGAVFAVYEIESGSGGAFYESGRCAAGILPGDVWFTTRPVPGFTNKCPFAGIADPVIAGSFYALAQDRPVAPRAVEVGGQTYTVDATVGVGYPWSGATYPAYLFAADVGVYARSWQSGSGSHYERHMWQLQYARVGGVEYGTPMPPTTLSVQVETPVVYVADPVAHLALTVTGIYPLRPRVDFHRLTGGIALRHVLDQIPVGTTHHALDVSALAPGTYLVRAVAGSFVSESTITVTQATLGLTLDPPVVTPDAPEATLVLNVTGGPLDVRVDVADSTGAVVLTRGLGVVPTGTTRHTLDVSALALGTYTVHVASGSHEGAAPLIVARAALGLALDPAVVVVGTPETTLALTVVGFTIVISVDVADSTGASVFSRELGYFHAGTHRVVLDVSAMRPGAYTVRVSAGSYVSEATLRIESPPPPPPPPPPLTETALAVRPNPARATLTATLTVASGGTARAEVVDLLGRVVLARDLGPQDAGVPGVYTLDTAGLPSGPYVLRVVTSEGVLTRRFVRGR